MWIHPVVFEILHFQDGYPHFSNMEAQNDCLYGPPIFSLHCSLHARSASTLLSILELHQCIEKRYG